MQLNFLTIICHFLEAFFYIKELSLLFNNCHLAPDRDDFMHFYKLRFEIHPIQICSQYKLCTRDFIIFLKTDTILCRSA